MLKAEHPERLPSMDNLGCTYTAQRRFSKAEELLGSIDGMRVRVLGGVHADTLASMQKLALVYWGQGR